MRQEIGGYPLVIRPGFTLGGTGGGIMRNDEEFRRIVERGLYYSPNSGSDRRSVVEQRKEFELGGNARPQG